MMPSILNMIRMGNVMTFQVTAKMFQNTMRICR